MNRTEYRHKRILELIRAGKIDVEALALELNVSTPTIRRDLASLSKDGVVTRTYGGAVLSRPLEEQTYSVREQTNSEKKEAIAKAALALIEDGDTLLLDSGTTIAALGRQLVDRKVKVITTNLAIVPQLVRRGIDVTVLGGSVRPSSLAVIGPFAEMNLRRLTSDKAFLSGDGIVAELGLCEATPEQCSLKELIMTQTRQTIVLADSSKLGQTNQQYWAQFPNSWTLITDFSASEEQLLSFQAEENLEIIIAEK